MTCTHPNAYPGLECYCPDCKQTFEAGTAKHKEIISREAVRPKQVLLGDKLDTSLGCSSPSNSSILNKLSEEEITPSNSSTSNELVIAPSTETELLGDKQLGKPGEVSDFSPSNSSTSNELQAEEISPSKTRRYKGEGSGCIHWKIITRGDKDYPQAWYHYEFWERGDRLAKKTKYIPKRLIAKIEQLEREKAPVREILKVLEGEK